MNLSNHILAVPRISYWLALVDFGPRLGIGMTASSGSPETTRRQIVDEVRSHIAKDGCVVHVRWVEGTFMADVTEEILTEAMEGLEADPVDRVSFDRDHARDLRKQVEGV